MKKNIFPFLLNFLLLFSCAKEKAPEIKNTQIIGHGGSGFQQYTNPLPSNSFASITRAIDGLQADGVEVDVQLTADNELVLYHDERLETLTGCTGCISNLTLEEVKKCRYIRDFTNKVFGNERIISLEEVLERYSTYQRKPYFYLDVQPGCPVNEDTLAKKLVKAVQRVNGREWITIESGSVELLKKIKRLDESISLMISGGDIDEMTAIAAKEGFNGLVTSNNGLSREQAQRLQRQRLKVVVYNVKEQTSTSSALKKQPDAIQTDNIELLQQHLNR